MLVGGVRSSKGARGGLVRGEQVRGAQVRGEQVRGEEKVRG